MSNQFGGDPIPGFDPDFGTVRLTQQNAQLKLINGPRKDDTFSINQVTMLVGRNDPPTVMVDIDLTGCELDQTPMVSRRHAELQWVDSELLIIDLGSKNKTFVDGKPLQPGSPPSGPFPEAVTLHAGNKIKFANIEMEVIAHDE